MLLQFLYQGITGFEKSHIPVRLAHLQGRPIIEPTSNRTACSAGAGQPTHAGTVYMNSVFSDRTVFFSHNNPAGTVFWLIQPASQPNKLEMSVFQFGVSLHF